MRSAGRLWRLAKRFAGIAHAPASSNCPSLGTRKKPSRNAGRELRPVRNARGQGFTFVDAGNRTASGPGNERFSRLRWPTQTALNLGDILEKSATFCSARKRAALPSLHLELGKAARFFWTFVHA